MWGKAYLLSTLMHIYFVFDSIYIEMCSIFLNNISHLNIILSSGMFDNIVNKLIVKYLLLWLIFG